MRFIIKSQKCWHIYKICQLIVFCLVFPISLLAQQDDYSKTFEKRKQLFFEHSVQHSPKDGLSGIFGQLSRLELGLPLEEHVVYRAIEVIRSNTDCNDFSMNGLLRLVYLMKKKEVHFSSELAKKVEFCILDFKYWWNDPRRDTTYRCYHTENHQALYHTAELLAGQLYPDRQFTSGLSGKEHQKHALELLDRWLGFRFRFGFSEWVSTYYDVDILLLANMIDFSEDNQVAKRATMVMDLLLYDLALQNFKTIIGSSSGRAYASSLITGHHEMSSSIELLFGIGQYLPTSVMAVSALATTRYVCPTFIRAVAQVNEKPVYTKQRIGLKVEDAWQYGLDYGNEKDVHLFWGMQEFVHPLVVKASKQISEKYDVWPHRDYDDYSKKYTEQIKKYGKIENSNLGIFAIPEANMLSYRTKDYMLSTVLDYRKGSRGYQHHIWQASLGNKAIVYTNHPGSKNMRNSPNYWAGNNVLPRAVQHENVSIIQYKVPENNGTDFTHAYFPKDQFDQVIEQGNWVFARKGKAYVALYSFQKTKWKASDTGELVDLVAKGRSNIWICELGDQTKYNSLAAFAKAILKTAVWVKGDEVVYSSPSQGKLIFGWSTDFTVNGKVQELRFDKRYSNAFGTMDFGAEQLEFSKGNSFLKLDFEKNIRSVN